MSYLEFGMDDISPSSFTFGRAFYDWPRPPFFWFTWVAVRARAIARASCEALHMFTIIGICMILDVYMLTCRVIFTDDFLKFPKFFWFFLYFVMFKNLLVYIWPLINFFVLRRDRFFTVYICFKKPCFSCKLFNAFPNPSALAANLGCQ